MTLVHYCTLRSPHVEHTSTGFRLLPWWFNDGFRRLPFRCCQVCIPLPGQPFRCRPILAF
jgi:hypothetical protein